VFDDDDAIGNLVVRIALISGLEATAVSNAEAFRNRLRTDPPEVVVLDLTLGGTDGGEQMRLLAGWQYTGALVLMSGFDASVLATARSAGMKLGLAVEGVLEKPLSVAKVVQVFERLRSECHGLAAASPL
jgi:FixJ family two-component response regulator